ncbi:MAG: beta-galactosidase GalA [Chitinophagaceae bacterium]
MRIFLVIAFLIASLISVAQRKHINIDENWKFAFGNASNPEKDFNYGIKTILSKSGNSAGTAADPKFNDSNWRSLDLPHDWAVELPFKYVDNFDVDNHGYKTVGGFFPETSIGWYRKKIAVNKADSGKRIQLQFDGIFRDAEVWINGFYLGNHKSGYIGVEYDVTDFISFSKENTITVRVNATQYEGWFYEGAGIYRHVWLNIFNNTHIANNGIYAKAIISKNNALLEVETTISNSFAGNKNISSSIYVADRNGKVIATSKEQNIALQNLQEQIIKHKLSITNPTLWTLENPYLYRVVAVVKENGKIVDEQQIRFGCRTIDIKPNGLFLNGKHIKILGTNNHQDHAGIGIAQHDAIHYYRIDLLKKMGSNAYRTSHHPPTPELLDACDSLGMLVMDEHRLLNSGTENMRQFEELIKRDRSRTCVFMWSIGNEEGWIHTTDIGKRIALSFIQKQQQLDPTRTCTYAADVANVFTGINEVIPVRSFNYREFAVADYHKDHPTQPIIGTEMGSTVTTRGVLYKDSANAYVPDQDITFPWWASTAEKWWSLAAVNDYWLGAFIWTGFDYRGEPTPYKWPNISSHFGVMDVCGFPKNIYYYYKSWWSNEDVLHISPHWNLENLLDKSNKEVEVWVNSNADSVELFLNKKSLGIKNMPRNSHLKWKVLYEPGTLEAIGYRKGKIIKAKVETTGLPTEIVLTPNKIKAIANGTDLVIVDVTVKDDKGREVPTANNEIAFQIEGDATIIGVGNGDPSSHEPDKCLDGLWKRSLFNGKCQIIIQAGKTVGQIKIKANAKQLKTSTILVSLHAE